jgi:hypothetical protein
VAPPRPLLEILRELNQERDGAPSQLLTQMRVAVEGWRNYAETAQGRELVEALRRKQESGLAERLMGRMHPVSPPQTDSVAVKRKRDVGRKPGLTPDQVKEGIRILRNQPKMTVEAASATLKQAGIHTSSSALYRLVIRPAYR